MKLGRRILAGLAILLCIMGLLLSIAGGLGVWIVKKPVTDKLTRVYGRIDETLDVADRGLDQVKTTLARAGERLETAVEEQRKTSREPQKISMSRRLLARTVQQQISPELGNAHETLHTVAEAAVVVNSVLDDVSNFSFVSATGLDVDRLSEINKSLSQVESSAWELSRLLGEPEPNSDAADTQLTRIEQALNAVRGLTAEYESRLKEVRQRMEDLKSRTLPWITPSLVFISFVCFWIALSQASLLLHAWSWWKGSGANSPMPN
jgi:F0F1-type ATP synthase membrane subunit b/b'